MRSFFQSKSNKVGKELFLAINDNDFEKFKTLINDPTIDLSITDHCDTSLEKRLGGDWSLYEGALGRYENNTLLNFALSMERANFAEELIHLHKRTGRDIGITKNNDANISPLNMAMMINGEYLLHYDKNHKHKDKCLLSNLKLLSKSEQNSVLEKTTRIITDLYSTQELYSILTKEYRIMLQPALLIQLFKQMQKDVEKQPKQANSMPYSLNDYASYAVLMTSTMLKYANSISTDHDTQTELQNTLQQIEKMKQEKLTPEVAAQFKTGLPLILHDLDQTQKRLACVTDNLSKIKQFVNLMQKEDFLNSILKRALLESQSTIENYNVHKRAMNANNRTKNSVEKQDTQANIFHLIPIFFDNKDVIQKNQAMQAFLPLVSEDMWALKDNQNQTLQTRIQAIQAQITQELPFANKIKSSSQPAPLESASPPEIKAAGPAHTITFRGQHRSPIKGAFAAVPAALAIGSSLLQLNDSTFKRLMENEDLLEETLSSCVLTGVDFNAAISRDKNDLLTPKLPQDILSRAKEEKQNYANIHTLDTVINDQSIELNHKLGDILPNLTDIYRDSLAQANENHPTLKSDDLYLILTAQNQTLSVFSRQNQFFLVNTAKTLLTGSIEIFNQWEDVVRAIETHWNKAEQCDVTLLSTQQRLTAQLQEEKVDTANDSLTQNSKYLEQAHLAVKNYIAVSKQDTGISKLFSAKGKNRADIYLQLLDNAENDFEQNVLLYAILKNTHSARLRTAIANSLDFFTLDPNKDIEKATNHIQSQLVIQLKDRNPMQEIDSKKSLEELMKTIIEPLNQKVEKGLRPDDALCEKLKSLTADPKTISRMRDYP